MSPADTDHTTMDTGRQPRPTIVFRPGQTVNAASVGATAAPAAPAGAPITRTVISERHCPACGYPVAGNATSCPSCGAQMPQGQPSAAAQQGGADSSQRATAAAIPGVPTHVQCDKCGQQVDVANKFCPHCGAPIRLKTMRSPRYRGEIQPQFSLTLVPDEDETIQPTTRGYTGQSCILNRANTEPSNITITSKEQAALSFKNGKWYIENRSEHGSTYVKVTEPTELKPGTVIMLGNREFRFETK